MSVLSKKATPSAEVEAYKIRVRQLALSVYDEGQWSIEHLNRTLVTLGLAPHQQYQLRIVATGTNTTSMALAGSTQAEAEADAKRFLGDNGGAGYVGTYNWKADLGGLRHEVVNMATEIDAEEHPDASTSDLATYKKLVRRVAIAEAKARDWCDSGLNDRIERIGLTPKQTYKVPVRVTATVEHTVMVPVRDAESYEEAAASVAPDSDAVKEVAAATLGRHHTVTAAATVTLDDVRKGDPDPTNSYDEPQCRRRFREPDYGTVRCTRTAHDSGQHIAGSGTRVLSVWPFEEGEPPRR